MANKLLYGFTPSQYGQASNLGYSNESFNALGKNGMSDVLRNGTRYQPQSIKQAVSGGMYEAPVNHAGSSVMDTSGYGGVYNTASGTNNALQNEMIKGQGLYNDMMTEQIKDMQGFDYMGASSLGFQGLGTAMQMGLYGDRKDYMQNVNAGLEQNLQNAEETHNTQMANTASYGSAFSQA